MDLTVAEVNDMIPAVGIAKKLIRMLPKVLYR